MFRLPAVTICCYLLIHPVAFGQSAQDWEAFKRRNGIDPSYNYNDWVAAGCPRAVNDNKALPSTAPNKSTAQQAADAQALHNADLRATRAQLEADAASAAVKAAKEASAAADALQFDRERNASVKKLKPIDENDDNPATSPHALKGLDDGSALSKLKPLDDAPSESNPLLVDARNVFSGLPKEIEDSIPATPAGKRVRKALEAVKDHDWQVAHAWFQDALAHDPKNPGLSRLVELSEPTLHDQLRTTAASQKNTQSTVEPSASYSTGVTPTPEQQPANIISIVTPINRDGPVEDWLKEEDPAWMTFMRYITSKLPKQEPSHLKGVDGNGIRG